MRKCRLFSGRSQVLSLRAPRNRGSNKAFACARTTSCDHRRKTSPYIPPRSPPRSPLYPSHAVPRPRRRLHARHWFMNNEGLQGWGEREDRRGATMSIKGLRGGYYVCFGGGGLSVCVYSCSRDGGRDGPLQGQRGLWTWATVQLKSSYVDSLMLCTTVQL